jgi:predicted RNA-binding protein with RPS1 domain
VDSVVPFGAFVRIADDAHGLLHGDHRPELGTAVTVRILALDEERKRVSLELT